MALTPSTAYNTIAQRVDAVRRVLAHIDTTIVAADAPRRDLLYLEKASTYIWLSSALEAFVNDFLAETLVGIADSGAAKAQLRPSLFAIVVGSELDGLQDVRRLKMWKRRASLFAHLTSPDPANLDPSHLPLDGRTLEPDHFDTIWQVFAFAGPSLPGPLQRLALVDLSEARNKLAHGEEDPVPFGRRKTVHELRRLAGFVEDVAEHLFLAGTTYVVARQYLR